MYVHVPFCERVCPYCDFAVVAARRLEPAAEETYVDALLGELEARRGAFAGRTLASLYLGGGTPSLLRPASLARIVDAVRSAFAPGPAVETTLEVNPGTLERERLPGFRDAGVGRVSLGVQSFDDRTLKRLGRAHRGDEARRSLSAARAAGFDAISLDLIFGAPEQGLADLERDLAEVVACAPEHVSIYELTLEAGTPFGDGAARGLLRLPAEDEVAAMHELVDDRLGAAGYEHYEISNHALPGFAAVHNRRYWERRPVLGLGVGAFSTDPPDPEAPYGRRRSNTRDLATYLERVRTGASPEAAPAERLDPATARGEAAFLALRQSRGLDPRRFEREFGRPPRGFWAEAIDRLVGQGLLREDDTGWLRLTARGRLFSDGVFEHFV